MIVELEKEFVGTGEVSGVNFKQISSSDRAFLYSRCEDDGDTSFEVFLRKLTPMCIDFDNRVYSEVDFKEMYPKSKDFGVWAWSYMSINKAEEKFQQLTNGNKTDNI